MSYRCIALFLAVLAFGVPACEREQPTVSLVTVDETATYEDGDDQLVVTTTVHDEHNLTIVVSGEGDTLTTVVLTALAAEFSYKDHAGTKVIPFPSELPAVPSPNACNKIAIYATSHVFYDSGVLRIAGKDQESVSASRRDNPGCDWFPDGQCALRCCALHDQCYAEHGCGASSWLPGFGGDDCDRCNQLVVGCIAQNCTDGEPEEGDRCYDARCDQFFDCGDSNCECESPCDDDEPPANSSGDVHIRTPDGLAYDFQGAGEYLLMASSDGSVVVQSRQQPWRGSDRVSVNTAAAMNVAGDRVGIYLDRSPRLYVNGAPVTLDGERLDLANGGAVVAASPGYVVRWPIGFVVSVRPRGSFINIGMARPAGSVLTYAGLLGNMNGDPADDIFTRAGMQVAQPIDFRDLYDVFGASWQITQDESLFDYEPGNDVATYAKAGFPERPLTVEDLDPAVYAAARRQCEAAGITNPTLLDDCILDIAVTGDADFLGSAQDVDEPAETLDIDVPVYFDGWTAVAVSASNGDWRVSSDGRSVLQTRNSNAPAFFISPGDYSGAEITGRFIVEERADDDFVGFVIGYTSPISGNGRDVDDFDFILFDWRQRDQRGASGPFAEEGFTLARVNGVIAPESGFYAPFWDHDDPDIEVLATRYGDDQGWEDRTEYKFRVAFSNSRVTIYIDEEQIFDVTGSFPSAGRFGFYTFSQAMVRFSDFEAR